MFKGKTRQICKRGQIHVGKPFFVDSEPFCIHLKHKPTKRAIRCLPKTAIVFFMDVHVDTADLA